MPSAIVASMIGFAGTVILAVFAAMWRMGGLASTLSLSIREHKEDINELRQLGAMVKQIPVIETRLAMIESALASLTSQMQVIRHVEGDLESMQKSVDKLLSLVPIHGQDIQVLKSQVGSLKELRAVREPYIPRPPPIPREDK
jgi:hypothetical protein